MICYSHFFHLYFSENYGKEQIRFWLVYMLCLLQNLDTYLRFFDDEKVVLPSAADCFETLSRNSNNFPTLLMNMVLVTNLNSVEIFFRLVTWEVKFFEASCFVGFHINPAITRLNIRRCFEAQVDLWMKYLKGLMYRYKIDYIISKMTIKIDILSHLSQF